MRKLSQIAKDTTKGIVNTTILATAFGALYLAATAVVNLGYYGFQSSIELAENLMRDVPKTKQTVTIDKIGNWKMRDSITGLDYAEVTREDGTKDKLVDGIRVLEGKFLPNRVVHDLEPGKKYEVTEVGSLAGDIVLDATEKTN